MSGGVCPKRGRKNYKKSEKRKDAEMLGNSGKAKTVTDIWGNTTIRMPKGGAENSHAARAERNRKLREKKRKAEQTAVIRSAYAERLKAK
jgi:hypothetical protein